jgi:hypothetical protein
MRAHIKTCFVRSLALAIVLAGGADAQAGKTVLTCPATLSTAPAAAAAPEGWTASRRAKEQVSEQKFSAVTFTNGNPDKLGFLMPSGESTADGEIFDDFDLASIPAENGVWLICMYENTPAFIHRKLDEKPAKCSAPQRGGNAEKAAVCE